MIFNKVYEIVDADVKRFIPPPKEIKAFTVLAKKEIQHRRHKILNFCRWTSRSERSPHAGSSFYMVDENPLDGVENIPE